MEAEFRYKIGFHRLFSASLGLLRDSAPPRIGFHTLSPRAAMSTLGVPDRRRSVRLPLPGS
jgi:hypothetical protein